LITTLSLFPLAVAVGPQALPLAVFISFTGAALGAGV